MIGTKLYSPRNKHAVTHGLRSLIWEVWMEGDSTALRRHESAVELYHRVLRKQVGLSSKR